MNLKIKPVHLPILLYFLSPKKKVLTSGHMNSLQTKNKKLLSLLKEALINQRRGGAELGGMEKTLEPLRKAGVKVL